MQLVLEPVICHYIRRPTSWASMDRINFTLHNFVSLDLQSRIHIVRLRWLNCGSELQCWGMLYCGRQCLPTGRPADRPTEPTTGRPADGPTEWAIGRQTDRPTDKRPTGRPTDRPADRPAERPTGLPTGRPAERPAGQPADRPTSQKTSRRTGRPSDPPTERPAE